MSDFHLLLEKHIPGLLRYAAALTRDADQADELIEDTVTEAFANQAEWAEASDPHVWLLTILHDLRSNPFRQTLGAESTTDHRSAALLSLSDLDRALAQLPEEQRAIILLIGLDGTTYGETAAILRLPLATMRNRLARARANLCSLMGVESHSAGRSVQTARAAA